jgi:hypothetical protein
MNDYRCRVSEEDRGDSHFDYDLRAQVEITPEMEREDAQGRRAQFKELLEELIKDADFMLNRPKWSPDEDDIEMLLTIQEELYWYASVTKNKEKAKQDDNR